MEGDPGRSIAHRELDKLSSVPVPGASTPGTRYGPQLRRVIRRIRGLSKDGLGYIPYFFALAGLIAAGVTFLSITGAGPIGPASPALSWVLVLNFALIFAILIPLLIGLTRIFRDLRVPESGAKLRLRFVILFGSAAVVPAAVIAAFLSLTIFRNIDAWFDTRVSTIVDRSVDAARAYVDTTVDTLRAELLAMAEDIDNARANGASDDELAVYLRTQAIYRNFSAAYLVDRSGQVRLRAESDRAPAFIAPTEQGFRDALSGDVAAKVPDDSNEIRALYRLRDQSGLFLYAVQIVDGSILSQLRVAESRVREYRAAETRQGHMRNIFILAYLQTTLLILFAAIWLGLRAANSVVGPVSKLVDAARRVREGDLAVRVPAREGGDEVQALSRAFNRMTRQLHTQTEDLQTARNDAENRSRFIEMVLTGVSAGVLALDKEGRITVANPSATALLAHRAIDLQHSRLDQVAPELSSLFAHARRAPGATHSSQVEFERDGEYVHVHARIAPDPGGDGYIVTLDDTTRLVNAQRVAAWKDVARRIAHEIKNPLTPIQLSTERLQRRYGAQITSEKEIFDRCIDTILRQVGDIRRMVDEFSAFARMPAPIMQAHDLRDILRDAVFAQKLVFPDIEITFPAPLLPIIVECDDRMIGQAFTNLIKNAAEAIVQKRETETTLKGRIEVSVHETDEDQVIVIRDNGPGFPAHDRRKLLEPYVSTRLRGSGLGLAIVKRAIEDHGGKIALEDVTPLLAGQSSGAQVRVTLPRLQAFHSLPISSQEEVAI